MVEGCNSLFGMKCDLFFILFYLFYRSICVHCSVPTYIWSCFMYSSQTQSCLVAIWGRLEVDDVTQRSFSSVYKHSLSCIYTSAFFFLVNFLSTVCWLRKRLLLALRRNHTLVSLNMKSFFWQILFSYLRVNTWISHSYSNNVVKESFPGHRKRTSTFFSSHVNIYFPSFFNLKNT